MEENIFKKGSTTYYFSSIFFPKKVREDVFRFYSFVRVVDDYVDNVPQRTDDFMNLRTAWNLAIKNPDFSTKRSENDSTDERVIKNIVHCTQKYDFKHEWVESFLDSMQADLEGKQYQTIDDTLWYIYGSAEVIGLMMAKIMGLSDEAMHAAKMQGRAMQYINFIRDIAEDNTLGRRYFPESDLKKFGLKDLSQGSVSNNFEAFSEFINFQLDRYNAWQKEAEAGYWYIPKRLRIPTQTASDMYNWTANQIRKNPGVVFKKKVKPTKAQIVSTALRKSL